MLSNSARLLIFMVFFFLSLCRFNVYAQQELLPSDSTATISMDLKDADLKDVLKILSIQSGLNFIASEAVMNRKITLYLDKVPIKKAMNKIFIANNLAYELGKGENIFIVKDWGKPQVDTLTKVYYIKYRSVPSADFDREKGNLLWDDEKDSSQDKEETDSASNEEKNSTSNTDIVDSVKQLLSPEGKISEDIKTNSLIVTDIPSRFKTIDKVIALLDVPRLQIMLDVEILDVSKNVVDKLGFDFGESPFTLLIPKNVKSYFGRAAAKGAQGAVTIGGTFAETLHFLRTQKDTRYLARPKLLTLNNETAEISLTKDEVVGVRETTITSSAGETTRKEFMRSTDLKLTPEGVGVFLRVTPQINPETNEITMVVNPKSSVTAISAISTTQADAEVRTTKSIVKVRNGETVILGGMMNKDVSVVAKKLPILGDIPILGAFFRHKDQEKDSERELLIFITPRILKEPNAKIANSKKNISAEIDNEPILEISRQEIINEFLTELDRKRR